MRCWMVCKINVSCSIDLTAGRRGLKMQTDQPRQTKWEGGHETFWNSLSRQHMLRHPGFFVNLPSSRRKEYWGSAAAQTHNSGPVQTQQVYYGNGEGEEAGGLRGVRVLFHEPSRTTCPSCCTNLAEKGKSSSEPQKVLVCSRCILWVRLQDWSVTPHDPVNVPALSSTSSIWGHV